MRDFKFRGIATYGKVFIYGSLITEINEAGKKEYFIKERIGKVEVRSETVGQYTGLKDKNSVDIYEGDILAFDKKEWGSEDDYIFTVEQSETGEWEGAGICTEWETYCEVIGNIYQNKELLQGG